ncbi:DUF1667 domain-containing protein [Clostridium sediminicola]|uniref:DUF1667 domain-containing protein n=1 Tax=Clostridium sediminicola TaxID=3114879 RepID=UPI0031F1FDA0
MEIRKMICIGCPLGCPLEVSLEANKVIEVKGNTCPKGVTYAEKECTNPTRIVCSSVFVTNGEIDCVPVKTENDIPKGKIFDCIKALKGIVVEAPVKIGDVIVEDVAGTGVDVVATRTIENKN